MIRSRNILPLILFHFLHNFIQFVGSGNSDAYLGFDLAILLMLAFYCIWLALSLRKISAIRRRAGNQRHSIKPPKSPRTASRSHIKKAEVPWTPAFDHLLIEWITAIYYSCRICSCVCSTICSTCASFSE